MTAREIYDLALRGAGVTPRQLELLERLPADLAVSRCSLPFKWATLAAIIARRPSFMCHRHKPSRSVTAGEPCKYLDKNDLKSLTVSSQQGCVLLLLVIRFGAERKRHKCYVSPRAG